MTWEPLKCELFRDSVLAGVHSLLSDPIAHSGAGSVCSISTHLHYSLDYFPISPALFS